MNNFVRILIISMIIHIIITLKFPFFLAYFPNSHAMESYKTNSRTGAVGSPLELVGGWCPGHVLMSCDVGVPVMF